MNINNPKETIEKIRINLENYISKNKLNSLVLGVSGGIDSALCAVLAKPICDKLNIPLIGRSITIETNSKEEIDRSILIGNAFCSDFKEINLTNLYLNTKDAFENIDCNSEEDIHSKKIRLGNIKARIRMVYLYNIAQKYKGLVLSTDNYTEYLVGFWTLHGDVGDLGMIQTLWKTEVYQLSEYIVKNELVSTEKKTALQSCIDAMPVDGLGISKNDLEQLKADSYFEVDKILFDFIHNNNLSQVNHPVIQRHLNSHYKRNNPYNFSREDII